MQTNIADIKAQNLAVMKEVASKLKAEGRDPAKGKATKQVPAAKLLKEVGIKATRTKGRSKQTISAELYAAGITERDAFVKALQVEFPDLSDFNARCYFNKVRRK